MADIQLRFNADMLVLSTPVDKQLERLGFDAERDNELMLLLEPEVLSDLYALEAAAGVQCLVTDTAHFTPARFAHSLVPASSANGAASTASSQFSDNVHTLAKAAIDVVAMHNPQHVLVEIGPCGLPLDPSSKASLNESKDQYERAVQAFAPLEDSFDAYFLNGFESSTDLKCALMGLRKKTDKPVFASVRSEALARETLSDAIAVMAEYGAQVAGFSTSSGPLTASRMATEASAVTTLPMLVQLEVAAVDPEQAVATSENPYFDADQMMTAADMLRAVGVQFLRAIGAATPSYAGALVAATLGERVMRPNVANAADSLRADELDELAGNLRSRIASALSKVDSAGDAGALGDVDASGDAGAGAFDDVVVVDAGAVE